RLHCMCQFVRIVVYRAILIWVQVFVGVAVGARWKSVITDVYLACNYLVRIPFGMIFGYLIDFQVTVILQRGRRKHHLRLARMDNKPLMYARSVAFWLRWENTRKSNREKQEQMEREARLKFEQQLEIERQARAEENIRREKEQREYERVLKEQLAQEQFKARPENQFIAERKKTSSICGGEVNLGGEPQQTQRDNNILDDKEYRHRVLKEKQRQTQLFSEQPCTQYILGGSKARKKRAYNERKKAEKASKNEPVQKVKSTKQVSTTRSAAQKSRRETEKEKKEDMERMAASSDVVTFQKLDLVPKEHVRVQPETLYASLTEQEKYNILLRRGQIKEQVVMGKQDGVSIGGNTMNQNKLMRFLY
ncbi:hypothetical protein MKX03_026654, partial [Papaver bracteatum]